MNGPVSLFAPPLYVQRVQTLFGCKFPGLMLEFIQQAKSEPEKNIYIFRIRKIDGTIDDPTASSIIRRFGDAEFQWLSDMFKPLGHENVIDPLVEVPEYGESFVVEVTKK